MKKLLVLFLFIVFINADELNKLYEEAQKLENAGKYKESMLLYKKIALQNKAKIDKVQFEIKKDEIIDEIIDPIEDKETSQTVEQILTSQFNVLPHHANYFLPYSHDDKEKRGRSQNEAKFQVSIKKPLLENFFGFHEVFNLGYTHTAWWQIYSDSSPFRETNYKPEFFVTVPYGKSNKSALKGYTLGLLHESNGQSGLISRSWNRVYLEGYFQTGNLFIIPRAWYRIPEDKKNDDNPDIHKYLGYGDLRFVYPYKSHTFKLLLRNNLNFDDNKGFAELDWTFPFFNSKNIFGYVQLSSGYGDSLIDYDTSINRFSFGISLSR